MPGSFEARPGSSTGSSFTVAQSLHLGLVAMPLRSPAKAHLQSCLLEPEAAWASWLPAPSFAAAAAASPPASHSWRALFSDSPPPPPGLSLGGHHRVEVGVEAAWNLVQARGLFPKFGNCPAPAPCPKPWLQEHHLESSMVKNQKNAPELYG